MNMSLRSLKIVATRCQILRLKYTQFDFGWGSAPDPAGELRALPQAPSWIEGERRGRERRCGKRGRQGEGNGRQGSGETSACPFQIPGSATGIIIGTRREVSRVEIKFKDSRCICGAVFVSVYLLIETENETTFENEHWYPDIGCEVNLFL